MHSHLYIWAILRAIAAGQVSKGENPLSRQSGIVQKSGPFAAVVFESREKGLTISPPEIKTVARFWSI